MTRAALAEARAFQSWQDYQEALKRAIAPLTEEHMQRRLMPGLRTPGEIAEHIVFGRALWLHRALGEGASGNRADCGTQVWLPNQSPHRQALSG